MHYNKRGQIAAIQQHRTNYSVTHRRSLDTYRNKDLSRNRHALPLAVPEQLTLRLSHDP
jgi:hypothetical protein